MENLEQVDDEELEDIIKRAREMEERYGHYFDMIIIYRYNTIKFFFPILLPPNFFFQQIISHFFPSRLFIFTIQQIKFFF